MSFFDNFSSIDFKKPSTIISLIIVAVVIVALSFTATYFYMNLTSTSIPDFSDSNIFEVQQWIDDNNLNSDQVEIIKEYNEEVTLDKVISQSINPDEKIDDEKLIVKVSKGKDPDLIVDLIDFSEMSEKEINQWFIDNLFTDVNIEYEASIDVEEGKLIRLNVEQKASRSEMIVITMSVGTKSVGIEVIMPNFSTYTKANIEAWSNENNVDIKYIYAYSDDVESGKVIMQDPKAESTILTGSNATVTISRGKAVIIPSLIGETESKITDWADNNDIYLKKYTVFSDLDEGLIVKVDPVAKTTISIGTTIKYYLSTGQVSVENYVNKPKSEFTDYIQDLNYQHNSSAKITVQYLEESSDTVVEGSIISMKFDNITYDSIDDSVKSTLPGTTITVTISTGKTITVEDKNGTTETAFKEYCSDLNLKTSKEDTRFSDTIASGSIISNDTGKFSENDTIAYILSKGAFTPDMSEYEGRTLSSARNILSNYISEGASSSWSIVEGDEVQSDYPGGSTVTCTYSGKTITCTISKGSPMTVEDYSGRSFDEFVSYLNSKDLTFIPPNTENTLYNSNFDSGLIISNDTSSKYAGESVSYTLSKGEFIPNYGSYSNNTISEAQALLANEVPDYLSGYNLIQDGDAVYSDSVAKDDIITCSYSNKTVSCTVSKGETVYEVTFGQIKLYEVIGDADASKESIEDYLNNQGIRSFFTVSLIDGGQGDQSGSVLSYPAAGTYYLKQSDPKLIITIQQ